MPLTRRDFLARAAALAASAVVSPRALSRPRFSSDPFTLGVASGYPHASGVTLWTRLAPRSLDAIGMPPVPVEVTWEIATDERFSRLAGRGRAIASPDWGHAVHVDAGGLEAGRWYWYRFRTGDAVSPTGRTRTAPGEGEPDRLRFAFAACQQYEQGYDVAYRHMAREDLDLVLHLGDYIYESSWGRNHVRAHDADEPYTLADYRRRYALYKSDEDLKAAHAAFPWLVTWDDHEVDNDYANDRSQDLDAPALFLARRAAAYQAYYEHMPLPAWARPRGPDMQLYARAAFGTIAQFCVLDSRQYRSHQVCPRPGRGGSNVVREEECPERAEPSLTLLGMKQEQWLAATLRGSRARWNVIAQQTPMAQADRRPGPGADFWTDGWDGYPQARQRLLGSIARDRVSNPLVLAGDVHMAAVADLKLNFDDGASPVVATELVCPSISSHGPSQKRVELLLQENPHIKFANGARRGYMTVELTAKHALARIRTVASVAQHDAPIGELAAYAVEDARPGAQRVSGGSGRYD